MAVYVVSLLSSYLKTNNKNRVSIYASCKICNVTYGLKCLNKFYMEQKLRLFNLQLNVPSPGAHPASCTMGTESFPRVKSGRGVTLTPHPLLVPLVMKEYSYTCTPPMGRTACTEPQCLYKGALYKNNERIFVHEFSPYAFGSMHYGNTIINLDCGSI